jgi:hypothetical protein
LLRSEYSALWIATENLDYDEVERLLAAGHDPNEICPAGWPTLFQGIDSEADSYHQLGYSDRVWDEPPSGRMLELYLKPGANPYLQDSKGADAFDLAGDRRNPGYPYHPGALEVLARYGFHRRSKPKSP